MRYALFMTVYDSVLENIHTLNQGAKGGFQSRNIGREKRWLELYIKLMKIESNKENLSPFSFF